MMKVVLSETLSNVVPANAADQNKYYLYIDGREKHIAKIGIVAKPNYYDSKYKVFSFTHITGGNYFCHREFENQTILSCLLGEMLRHGDVLEFDSMHELCAWVAENVKK